MRIDRAATLSSALNPTQWEHAARACERLQRAVGAVGWCAYCQTTYTVPHFCAALTTSADRR